MKIDAGGEAEIAAGEGGGGGGNRCGGLGESGIAAVDEITNSSIVTIKYSSISISVS